MTFLTLAHANHLIDTALAQARGQNLRPMAVAVLDTAGHLIAFQREDGASMFRQDIAIGKAWASVAMGASSRTLLERAQHHPAFFNALSSTSNGRFIPQTGAVLIIDAAGAALGAIGASGDTGDADEAICIAAVQIARLQYT
ncbi:GlcG/HbpS family heme-binding protein [Pseudomonas sp. MWU13-2105]|uniref:GlcG/HbpS family heme-binding protein n=1 Tax=Pseudomonas sp. MWU13-2105 TaxID=2935074 RepID=UPI00200CCC28|nr:heme-binding protein [Pseudomonas sp. MWU13-2105]